MVQNVGDLISIKKSSWLMGQQVIEDVDYGYMVSFNPKSISIPKTLDDIHYITVAGDRIDNIAQKFYVNRNYAMILYLINSNIVHPLCIEPGITIRIPSESAIFDYLRNVPNPQYSKD